jgi:hypothetical protein
VSPAWGSIAVLPGAATAFADEKKGHGLDRIEAIDLRPMVLPIGLNKSRFPLDSVRLADDFNVR